MITPLLAEELERIERTREGIRCVGGMTVYDGVTVAQFYKAKGCKVIETSKDKLPKTWKNK